MGKLYDKCKRLTQENYEIVKDSMGKASGGDADGAIFVFDEPVTVNINLNEPLLFDIHEQECVLGVFFSDNRICPADWIVISRTNGFAFRAIPFYSEDLHKKIKESLLELKGNDKLIGFRWNERDGIRLEETFRIAKDDMHCLSLQTLFSPSASAKYFDEGLRDIHDDLTTKIYDKILG